jgi:hypothetical protein
MNAPDLRAVEELVATVDQPGEINPWRLQEALRRAGPALRMMMQDGRDGGPRRAHSYPTHARETWDPQFTGYQENQIAPNVIMVVPAVAAIPANTTGALQQLTFQAGPGVIVGWRGTAWDTTPGALAAGQLEQATMQVRMSLNGNSELIRNGLGTDFVPFANVFAGAQAFSPLARRVCADDILQLQFRNVQPAGGSTLQPELCFAFIATNPRP